jgi:hypothetical protein
MDSIYFTDPLGLLVELASHGFEPPAGHTHADVLLGAHRIRVARRDYNIGEEHLADAIETLVSRARGALSDDRSPRRPTTERDGSHGFYSMPTASAGCARLRARTLRRCARTSAGSGVDYRAVR